jgi:type IV secretion system protein VirB1
MRGFIQTFLFVSFLTSGVACAGEMETLLHLCAPMVHPNTMGSIVANESSGNPYAILDDGPISMPASVRQLRVYHPQTKAEAISVASALIRAGHVIDMGLGQVNSRNLNILGLRVEDLFDPCTNLNASQSVLLGYYEKAIKVYGPGRNAMLAAISGYNTGSLYQGFNNGYVGKVLAASRHPIPQLKVAPPIQNGVMRVSQRVGSRGFPTHGVLTHRPTLLDAKFSSIEVDSF